MTYPTQERVAVSDDGMARPRRYYVQDNTGIDNEESGVFYRYYDIESYGDSLAELIDNAMIFEMDRDGVEMEKHGLYNYGDSVIRTGERILSHAFLTGGNKG